MVAGVLENNYADDSIPETVETFNPESGLKTVVQHFYDENGDLVKETREYRKGKQLVSSQVAQRKAWKKYGAAKNDPPGGNSANTYPADVVTMQLVQQRLTDVDQDRQDDASQKSKSRTVLSCRICKGNHFSHQCPNKSDMEAMQALQNQLQNKMDGPVETKETYDRNTSGRYVPPALRNAQGGTIDPANSLDKRASDRFTVRVINLPPETTVEDLKLIFSSFGRITRIFPARDKATKQNRGFAFISYATEEQAKAAIYGVNGLRHNHVVLRVDWSKPPSS